MPYYSVQMKYTQEVCVKAKDESEAEHIAENANFETVMCDVECEAEEMYNDPGDEDLVQQFKDEEKYAE